MIFCCILGFSACKKDDCPTVTPNGKRMVLIALQQFFSMPYVRKTWMLLQQMRDMMTISSTLASSFGVVKMESGKKRASQRAASSFWDDSTSQETLSIKAALDAGGVELFAMTADGDTLDPTRGFKAWIDYALPNNPDIEIALSLPMIDFPADWDERAQAFGYDDIHQLYPVIIDSLWHTNVIDVLRAEYPGVNIYSIPTGWAGITLAQMQEDSLLNDDIDLFGAKPTSIFTDAKGHQGQIVIEAGTLIWLASICVMTLRPMHMRRYETWTTIRGVQASWR